MTLTLAQSTAPTLFQRLVFHGQPSLPVTTLYSFFIVAVLFAAVLASSVAMFSIWWERKVAGRIQSRHGPNRTRMRSSATSTYAVRGVTPKGSAARR